MNTGIYLILDGKLVTYGQAGIHPVNRGIMYGDGCFETLKAYPNGFLEWDKYFNRLTESAAYLKFEVPFSSESLKELVLRLLEENAHRQSETMVRIQLFRKGGRGYTTSSREVSWLIQTSPFQKKDEALILHTAETRCIPSAALNRRVKLSNGLNYIKAATEASEAGADDALMLTVDGIISETTVANIFWIKGDILYTPDVSCDLLPGITRQIVLQLCREEGIQLSEGRFAEDEIAEAETVFCCNSLREIQAVQALDGISYDPGHKTLKSIKALFEAFKNENIVK